MNSNKEFKAILETRTSKKGNTYEVLVIKLTDNLDKLVWLEQAELELLKMNSSKPDKSSNLFK